MGNVHLVVMESKVTCSAPVVETYVMGEFMPVDSFCDTPVTGCRVEGVENLLACAWLCLHDDSGGDFDDTNRLQVITPIFVNPLDQPVLIHTVGGKLVMAPPLRAGEPVIVDLLAAHALVPERYAKAIVARQGDQFPRFNRWYKRAALGKSTPTLIWQSRPVNGR